MVKNAALGAVEKSKILAPIVRGWRNYHRYCDMQKHSLWHENYGAWKAFNKQPKLNRDDVNALIKIAFPTVGYSENKFINVKGKKSPYDGDILYWSKRNSKLYDGPTAQTLKKQLHLCGYCGRGFMDEQRIKLHHIDGNHSNWKPCNLSTIHQSCHDIVHPPR